jgi:NAD(P)-dependent dehydrogenase (short-subunit alcohol dehydrogenase family)
VLGRPGRPKELTAAVLFLASEHAAYVNGQVLRDNTLTTVRPDDGPASVGRSSTTTG